MKVIFMFMLCLVAGCGGPQYRNIGVSRDVEITRESVERLAEKHGVTNAEAAGVLAKRKDESDRRRTEEHAAKYGISLEEAKGQLDYAASTGNIGLQETTSTP